MKKCGVIFSFLLIIGGLMALSDATFMHQQKIEKAKVELKTRYSDCDNDSLMVNGLNSNIVSKIANSFSATIRKDTLGISSCIDLPYPYTIKDVYSRFPLYIDHFCPLNPVSLQGRTTLNPSEEPRFKTQSYFDTINLSSTWNITKGEGVLVAIIDTGIIYNHQEFYDENGNTIISNKSYNVTSDKIVADHDNDYSLILDSTYHGTSVASLIAAQVNSKGITGIAPDVDLLIIKAETKADLTFVDTYDLVRGLSYAISCNADVINMSVQYYGEDIFAPYLEIAKENNIIVVGAAGNNKTSDNSYPAANEYCIGVGALAENSLEKADYSNYGISNVTIMAPGTRMFVAYNNSTSSYYFVSGTSFSSPLVAGALALYRSKYPLTPIEQIKELLIVSAQDLGDKGCDETFGYGLLNVDNMFLGERGTLTYDFLDSNVENQTQIFIKGNNLQIEPVSSINGKIIEGWYYDKDYSNRYEPGTDILNDDTILYAKYKNYSSEEVIELIEQIGDLTEENYLSKKEILDLAKYSYDSLSDSQKEEVNNYDTLLTAISLYNGYEFITYYKKLRIEGDICWLLNSSEFDNMINLYNQLSGEGKELVDNYYDYDDITIRETIEYLKSLKDLSGHNMNLASPMLGNNHGTLYILLIVLSLFYVPIGLIKIKRKIR